MGQPRLAAPPAGAGKPASSTGGRFVYVATAFAALGGLLFGYDTGVISGAVLFLKQRFALTPGLEEVVVSAVLVGAVAGALAGGFLADRAGRRVVIIGAAALFAAAAVGTALSQTVGWLIAGRVAIGIAIGVASLVAPMYISEIAPSGIRGSLVAVNQLALTVGIVVSYLVDYAFAGIQGWQWMFGLAAIPAIALGAGMLFLPDSPRWLTAQGRPEKAGDVLRRIRPAPDVGGELKEIQQSLEQQSGGWGELVKPMIRPALVVGIGLAIFQQVTGINTVIYYAPTIFQYAGFKSASASILATVGVGVVNVGMTAVALVLLDRVGRRPLLLIGLVGMIAALGMLGAAFHWSGLSGVLGWVALGSLVLYVGSFAVGLGPVFWLLISEIYPLRARGLAMSLATFANWGANLCVAVTFLTLIQVLGRPWTFWLYALVGIGGLAFAYAAVPETRGRTLEDIEAHWRSGKHPRAMGK